MNGKAEGDYSKAALDLQHCSSTEHQKHDTFLHFTRPRREQSFPNSHCKCFLLMLILERANRVIKHIMKADSLMKAKK